MTMQIPLNHFEQYVDETILKRGLKYFKTGLVHQPEEISPGEYEAIVEGTEDYTVKLTLKNGVITEHVCNCPYDMGPVCKHVVAVIFYLQQDELGLTAGKKKTKNKTPAKRKTITEQLDELLAKVSHDELMQFVREQALENASFRNVILSSFVQHNTNESKEVYAKQVKSILKAVSNRHGFIDWSSSRLVNRAVDNLLVSAQKQMDRRNFRSTIFICAAVMEQMTLALQFADDSNGDIGGCVEAACQMLDRMATEKLPEETRKQLIEYCFTSYEKQVFSGWDWHLDVLRLSALLIKTEEETVRILKLIDQEKKSQYEMEEAQNIKYEVLLKTKDESVAEKFLKENIHNSNLRQKAIEKALKGKEFDRAISLAKDGINYDMNKKPGLVRDWYDWLLKIAQAQNDTEKIIEYARFLFIDHFNNEQDYYAILKEQVKPEQWNTFIEAVIQDISKRNRWLDSGMIAQIFIKEQWWPRLLALVKETPSLNTLDAYEKYLSKLYSKEIAALYADAVLNYLKENVGRNYYQTACRYIRKIIKLGARDIADEVVAHLRAEYPSRKALMEELEKV